MRNLMPVTALVLAAGLPGCISTITSVATAPVRVAGKAVDWTTTSQSEADRNRGRAMRHREERIGKLQRDYRESTRACNRGDQRACDKARTQYDELQASIR